MALPGEAREGIISRVDVDGVTVKIGIKNLQIELDIKLLKGESCQAYKAYMRHLKNSQGFLM